MYSGSKYLVYLTIDSRANNSKISSGLPHSEIHGSKPILGSPWLNAEYHVLHRLLLPRHPPNALFALDLIQKKQNLYSAAAMQLLLSCQTTEVIQPLNQKHVLFPALETCCSKTLHRSKSMRLCSTRAD